MTPPLRRLVFVLLAAAHPATAAVTVRVQPSDQQVVVGRTFTVDVVADFGQPVVGWGLDVTATDDSIAARTATSAIIGPSWFACLDDDAERVAGLACPLPVSGAGVLLATVELQALQVGTVDVAPTLREDLTEGFALETVNAFDSVIIVPAHVHVTPSVTAVEPGGPSATKLALYGVRPNPLRGSRHPVQFSLSSAAPAWLDLDDAAGRRLARVSVGELGPGLHEIDPLLGRALPPGLYFLRLAQAGHEVTAKFAIFR